MKEHLAEHDRRIQEQLAELKVLDKGLDIVGYKCLLCEDTGQVWMPDPAFPDHRQADILTPCSCKLSSP